MKHMKKVCNDCILMNKEHNCFTTLNYKMHGKISVFHRRYIYMDET